MSAQKCEKRPHSPQSRRAYDGLPLLSFRVDDAETWQRLPLTDDEQTVAAIADWGPAEDWADWADGSLAATGC